MVISMLSNWSYIYSSYYFIKFIGFIPIYYVINLNYVLSCIVFRSLCFGFIESIILIFFSKKNIVKLI